MMAMLSACSTLESDGSSGVVEDPEQVVIFTASLGADTKTYLEYDSDRNVYKTVWEEDDQIWIYDPATGDCEYCSLVSGAGTTEAKFAGTIEADSYVALYAQDCEWGYGYPTFSMPERVWYTSKDGIGRIPQFAFPMAASSDTRFFDFKNLCSIIKLSVTGTDYLYEASVKSNDDYPFSGRAKVLFDEAERPYMAFEKYNETTLMHLYETLQPDTPKDLYFVIPPGEYPSGITVELRSEKGYMDIWTGPDIVFEPSQIRSFPTVNYETEYWNVPDETWGLTGGMTQWADGADINMTFEKGYFVLRNQYVEAYEEFKFRRNGVWDNTELGKPVWVSENLRYMPTNTSIEVADAYEGSSNINLPYSGTFDFYLDPDARRVYIMTAGTPLESLPSTEDVIKWSYQDMRYMKEGDLVKVGGVVMAENEDGVVIRTSTWGDSFRHIFVKMDQNSADLEYGNYVDIYARISKYTDDWDVERVELDDVCFVSVVSEYVNIERDVEYDLTDPDEFRWFYNDEFASFNTLGHLVCEDGQYYLDVVGADERKVRILDPVQDLSGLIGQRVYLQGYLYSVSYFEDQESIIEYFNTILKDISLIANDGSTENTVPGDYVILN